MPATKFARYIFSLIFMEEEMNNTINTIIKNYSCLSEEQTIQLCERIKNGDNEARNTLALSNVGLIFEALKQMNVSDEDKELKFYVTDMLENNLIERVGHGIYSKKENTKEIYSYSNSDDVLRIREIMKTEFPLINFCIWDLTILNKFVNHLIGHNHIIMEVEKDGIGFVYESLKERLKNTILMTPNAKELERYSTDNDVFLIN